jgi:hypothetical protein
MRGSRAGRSFEERKGAKKETERQKEEEKGM